MTRPSPRHCGSSDLVHMEDADEPRSMIEEFENEPTGAQELAAARLALSVSIMLASAQEATSCSGVDLAKLLGLTEGAVSQVLNGDGNLRISTLGRYARAMGYQACIYLHPAVAGVPPVKPELPINHLEPDELGTWSSVDDSINTWVAYVRPVDQTIGHMVLEPHADSRPDLWINGKVVGEVKSVVATNSRVSKANG